ncbi:MAG: hypothetical protein LQ345_002363 [Seirophora villosa]|nr:MAG: hypothetical protein LQ345_002363 [Seirophora villosa]
MNIALRRVHLEDDEIHISEATTIGPSDGDVSSGDGLALQDSQMQLMLSEQQNKRLRARQEAEFLEVHPHWIKWLLQKSGKGDIRQTQWEGIRRKQGFHVASAFRDAPVVKDPLDSNSTRRFDGEVPVFDLQALMDNDTDGTAFVVIRTVKCSETSVLRAIAGGPLRWTEAIHMKSRLLQEAIGSVATCYFQPIIAEEKQMNDPYDGSSNNPSGDNKSSSKRNQIDPADLFIFHHRALLKEYASTHPETSPYISALLAYTLERFGAEYEKADNLFACGIVDQEHILHLFKPNDVIVSRTHGKPAALVLQDWPRLDSTDRVMLTCWSFQTDGWGFARRRDGLSILPIAANTVNIQDLAAYPLRFATKDMQGSIRDRGRKYWALRIATQITYKGWNVARDQFYPGARFMVDHKIHKKMHENAKAFNFERPETTRALDRMPAYLDVDDEPSETSFLLLPPAIHGFYLNEKKWIHLFVDDVHPVSYNTMAFERLVLPTRTKELVRALVTVRTSQRGVKQGLGVAGKRTDITSGKGNGLIMLMHGGPGTGKTLTAESVAEIAKMPLYRVTCGDVGTNTDAVEEYLDTVLHLGRTWNCVLLLDEADVFLEERSMSDLKRNSLVSVFLRVLEYYDGILILTSNRVGMLDEAFKSRIQVALHCENLNRSARKKIWQNFLDMLEEDEEDVNFGEIRLRLDDLAAKELNGRQIRNVLTVARQLAIYRKERLDYDHLDQALSVSSDFSEYLKRVQGHTDDQRMRDIALR